MTYEEAIKYAKETNFCTGCPIDMSIDGGESCNVCEHRAFFEMAINALENQIQKEPILRSNGPLSFMVTACCPRCGSTNYDKYCSNCGQRIIKVAPV